MHITFKVGTVTETNSKLKWKDQVAMVTEPNRNIYVKLLELRLRKQSKRKGGEIVRDRGTEVCLEITSLRNISEAVPMKNV